MGQRYYLPNQGRWISRDPIGYAGGINLYSYAGNNPINRVDPSGLSPDGFLAGAATGLVVTGGIILLAPTAPLVGAVLIGFAAGTVIGGLIGYSQHDSLDTAFTDGAFGAFGGAELAAAYAPGVGVSLASRFSMRGGSTSTVGSCRGGTGPVTKGQQGVDRMLKDVVAAGGEVLGTEVSVETSAVRVRADAAIEYKGRLILLDSKNGPSAGLQKNQKIGYPLIRSQGGIIRAHNLKNYPYGTRIGPTPVYLVHF